MKIIHIYLHIQNRESHLCPILAENQRAHRLSLSMKTETQCSMLTYLFFLLQKYREKGVFHFTLHVPEKTSQLTLVATYQDDYGDTASATAQGMAFYSPKVQSCLLYVYMFGFYSTTTLL